MAKTFEEFLEAVDVSMRSGWRTALVSTWNAAIAAAEEECREEVALGRAAADWARAKGQRTDVILTVALACERCAVAVAKLRATGAE